MDARELLRQRQNAIWTEMRELSEQAEREKRKFTDEETNRWNELIQMAKKNADDWEDFEHKERRMRLTLEQARAASELAFPHKPDESEFMSIMTENLRFAFMEGVRFAGIK